VGKWAGGQVGKWTDEWGLREEKSVTGGSLQVGDPTGAPAPGAPSPSLRDCKVAIRVPLNAGRPPQG